MNYSQFCVLRTLIESDEVLTQKDIAKIADVSIGTVNKAMKDLEKLHLYENREVTAEAIKLMEQYRVKRAVFIAAGFGSRLMPITLNTPKPLVKIHGKSLIETSIDAVLKCGIKEIYIVVGYLGDQFETLLKKYPMIHLLRNNEYQESNNITSAIVAKEYMNQAYILDADLLVKNPSIFHAYEFYTNYVGIPCKVTNDWYFKVHNNIVVNIGVGGTDCYQWVGISYWSREDGLRLKKDLVKGIATPGGKELFWDQVPFQLFKKNYKIHIRSFTDDDVNEIDSYTELCAADQSYCIKTEG